MADQLALLGLPQHITAILYPNNPSNEALGPLGRRTRRA